MKSIQDLKKMQKKKKQLYERLENTKDINEDDKDEQMIIAGTWVDFIDDLLDHNLCEFMDKNGYTDEDIENTFTVEDEKVQKEIVIREEQALELLEGRKKLCEKHPYGVTTHLFVFKGIYIEKIELDILKWFLEIE